MSETATQTIVRNSVKTFTATDVNGRKIACSTLTALQRMNLVAAAGRELSANDAWMEFAWTAAMVTAIDGVPIPAPRTRRDIEANVTMLESEGIEAVILALIASKAADAQPADATPAT